jgi:pyruvate carboxylase
MAFGDIVKVTPSSKVVGDLAIFLVSHDMTIGQFASLPPDHNVSVPNSVVDMFEGSLGEPEGGWPERIRQVVLKGKSGRPGRPGEHLKPADFAAVREKVAGEIGREPSEDEVLSYLMYPDVFLKFARAKGTYGDVDVLPTPQFFYGMDKGEEVAIDIEEGKTLVVKFLAVSDPHEDGTRTVFFELNGRPREVDVRDRAVQSNEAARRKADPAKPSEVGAPLPGVVISVAAKEGEMLRKGDKLLVIEAMKMQSTVYTPVAGKVTKLLSYPGQQVEAKDLLAIVE